MKGPDDPEGPDEVLGEDALEQLGTPRRGNQCERVTILRPAGCDGVELWRAEKSLRHWQVFHDRYAICNVDPGWRGAARWRCRGREYEMTATTAQVFEPGDSHKTFHVAGAADFHVLMIDPHQVSELLGTTRERLPHFHVGVVHDSEAWQSFQGLVASLRGAESSLSRAVDLTSYVKGMFDRAGSRTNADAPRCDRRAARVRELIMTRYAEDLRLEDLAREVDVTPATLIRLFEKTHSLPVHRFQMAVRLSKARELLRAGARPSEVSEAVGFYDPAHFRLMFRRYYGFTPSHYFQQMQGQGGLVARRR